MTIGEDIRERAEGVANTTPDWYANELYSELITSCRDSLSRD